VVHCAPNLAVRVGSDQWQDCAARRDDMLKIGLTRIPPAQPCRSPARAHSAPMSDPCDDLVALFIYCCRNDKVVRVVPPIHLDPPQPVELVVFWELFAVGVDQVAEQNLIPESGGVHTGELALLREKRETDFWAHGCELC
jgi:hypothetical protein